MKAVIMAGGKGTRLAPYTKILPKPLMPIGDMPILEVILRQMKAANVEEVTLTVGHLSELLKAFFQNGERFGISINYSYEESPLGTAGPLAFVPNLLDTFLVSNGDVLTTLNLCELIQYHQKEKAVATIAAHQRQVKIDYGVIETNHGPEVCKYVEKPTIDYMVSMGIYVFEPAVLAYIPRGKYLDFPDLVRILLAAGERVVVFPFSGYWQDLGRPDDYESASVDFEKMQSQFFHEVAP